MKRLVFIIDHMRHDHRRHMEVIMEATDLFKKTDIKRLSDKLSEVEGRSTTRLLSVDDCVGELSNIMRWPISKKKH